MLWQTDQWFFSSPWLSTESTIPKNGIWNNPIHLIIYRQRWALFTRRLWNRKQSACGQCAWMRENGGSLNFNCISLPSPEADENWARWLVSAALVHFQKMKVHILFQLAQISCERQIHLAFPLSHITAWRHFPLRLMHVFIMFFLVSCRNCALYSEAPYLYIFFSWEPNFRVHLIPGSAL